MFLVAIFFIQFLVNKFFRDVRVQFKILTDQVFRYFATYKLVDEKGNSEVLMTPQDFLR